MFSKWRDDLRGALGLRIAVGYAVIVVASAFALGALTGKPAGSWADSIAVRELEAP